MAKPTVSQVELLLTAVASARLLGVSRTRFYELRRVPGFPDAVTLPGDHAASRYRRRELESWVDSLPPRRAE